MRKLLFTLVTMIGFVCLSASSEVPDFGPKPTPAHLSTQMNNYRAGLKDPYTAIISNPTLIGKYKQNRGWLNGGGDLYGWMTSFDCNAKNSYGAYVGVKTEYRFFYYVGGTLKVTSPIGGIERDRILELIMEPLAETPTIRSLPSTARFKAGIFNVEVPQGIMIVRTEPTSPNRHLVTRIIISVNDKSGSNEEMGKLLTELIVSSEDGSPIKIKTMDLMGNNIREDLLQLYKINK